MTDASRPAVAPPRYGNAGSPLPGHPGAECVWGAPYEHINAPSILWQRCSDPFCPKVRRVPEPNVEAATEAVVEAHLRGEISEERMRSRLNAIDDEARR